MPTSPNKQCVQDYMDAYHRGDQQAVLATLAQDVQWVVPGAFHRNGAAEFAQEMNNPAADGPPTIRVTRLIEEADTVVCEGTVRARQQDGNWLHLVFCDVFELRDAKIRKLTSYLMPVPPFD